MHIIYPRPPLPAAIAETTPGEFSIIVDGAHFRPTRSSDVLGLILWAYNGHADRFERSSFSTFGQLFYNAAQQCCELLSLKVEGRGRPLPADMSYALDCAAALADDPTAALSLRLRVRYLAHGEQRLLPRLKF